MGFWNIHSKLWSIPYYTYTCVRLLGPPSGLHVVRPMLHRTRILNNKTDCQESIEKHSRRPQRVRMDNPKCSGTSTASWWVQIDSRPFSGSKKWSRYLHIGSTRLILKHWYCWCLARWCFVHTPFRATSEGIYAHPRGLLTSASSMEVSVLNEATCLNTFGSMYQ